MKAAGQDLKSNLLKLKDGIKGMPKKKKIIGASVLGGILLIALAGTLILNIGKMGYRVLYEGLEPEEQNTIYAMLQDMGVSAQINGDGNIVVPSRDYDQCLLELATKGYPQSALTYGLFENHSGMTTTEAESKQWRLYQLQDRIQATLKGLQGVSNAVVTIDVPDTGTYVWEKDSETQQASAGVTLSLTRTLSEEQVSAIKNLIASSVPQLSPENVTVLDASTMQELVGSEDQSSGSFSAEQNLEFEKQVQKQLEDNVLRVLAPRYGTDGVVAVAKAVIDYDKMMTEEMTLQEKEGGGGYTTDFSEQYSIDGDVPASGIVGEENNTDIPEQAYDETDENGTLTDYNRDIHYDYGYIKTQIEKGNAILKDATISVMVDEMNMTDMRRRELTDLISKSTGIAAENISVSPIIVNQTETDGENDAAQVVPQILIPSWGYILAVAGCVLVLLLLLLLLRRRAKRKNRARQNEIDEQRAQMEYEIEQYKKQLSDAAKAATNPKDEAIINEVKDFAKQNPEITANLLRAWLKEDAE